LLKIKSSWFVILSIIVWLLVEVRKEEAVKEALRLVTLKSGINNAIITKLLIYILFLKNIYHSSTLGCILNKQEVLFKNCVNR